MKTSKPSKIGVCIRPSTWETWCAFASQNACISTPLWGRVSMTRKALVFLTSCDSSEEVFVTHERVSGFPEKGADLWGSLGNFRGSPGNFQGSPGNFRGYLENFRGTSGLLLNSTVRELPGKSPGNFRGSSGNFRGSPERSRNSGEHDSLPATRQMCLR